MPVANRAWLRLTPTGAPHPTRDYLKAQPPACSAMGASLAVLALFIVICLVVQRLCARWRSPRSSLSAYPLIACTSEIVDKDSAHKGPGPAVSEKGHKDQNSGDSSTMGAIRNDRARLADNRAVQSSPLAIDPQWNKSLDDSPLGLMSRRPPAPPLTPPEPSTSVFTLTRKAHNPDSFMHQPNPDYMSSTESPTSQTSPSSPSAAQRQSYTRMVLSGRSESQNSSPTEHEQTDVSFLSTSYPPTTSLLPPPPPGLQDAGEDPRQGRQIEVQGEIISMLDDGGAGWTRHTRVYGGGVCLACAASGGDHGGGFYGANVSAEEMH